jgi:hypothetical protein
VNFGILPPIFADDAYARVRTGPLDDISEPSECYREKRSRSPIENKTRRETMTVTHDLSPRQVEMVLKDSLLALAREQQQVG